MSGSNRSGAEGTAPRPSGTLSIVVPTRDRVESLARCLTALAAQRGPRDVEVIVVDDSPAGSVDVRTVELIDRMPMASLVSSGARGPAAARNAGAAAGGGEIVCFTDDDCEPDPDWASKLADRVDQGAAAVAGKTLNAVPADRLAEASQHIANYLGEYSRRSGAPFAASNNLACRAEIFRQLRFDDTYPLAAGEDRAWCEALADHGFELAYAPGAIVRHRQQLTARTFWRQHARYGRGAYRFGRDRGGLLPSRGGLYPRLVGSAFAHGPRVGVLVCAAQVATAAGFIGAAIAERRAR